LGGQIAKKILRTPAKRGRKGGEKITRVLGEGGSRSGNEEHHSTELEKKN